VRYFKIEGYSRRYYAVFTLHDQLVSFYTTYIIHCLIRKRNAFPNAFRRAAKVGDAAAIAFKPKPKPDRLGSQVPEDNDFWEGIRVPSLIPGLLHQGNFVLEITDPNGNKNSEVQALPFPVSESWDNSTLALGYLKLDAHLIVAGIKVDFDFDFNDYRAVTLQAYLDSYRRRPPRAVFLPGYVWQSCSLRFESEFEIQEFESQRFGFGSSRSEVRGVGVF
jgi:hypothetical protein